MSLESPLRQETKRLQLQAREMRSLICDHGRKDLRSQYIELVAKLDENNAELSEEHEGALLCDWHILFVTQEEWDQAQQFGTKLSKEEAAQRREQAELDSRSNPVKIEDL